MVQTTPKAGKTSLTKAGKKPRGKGVKFRKNNPETGEKDGRINRTGQNAKFTELRHKVNEIFNERLPLYKNGQPVIKDGKPVEGLTQLEMMMRDWIASRDFQKQNRALEYGVGKVPDELIQHSDADDFVRENIDLLTDGQIERLRKGESSATILAELMRDTIAVKRNKAKP